MPPPITLPPEKLAILRPLVLKYVYSNGTGPDLSVPVAKMEQDLGLEREEMRAVHMAILVEGLVAERARSGHIGLSQKGKFEAQDLLNEDR